MLEVLDIGNTHIRVALWDGATFQGVRRFSVGEMPYAGNGYPRAAACVNPAVKTDLCGVEIHFIAASDENLPVDFSHVDTSTLGADRVANAIAAAGLYPLPAVVIDCGTAITMEVVDADRCFAGGAIAPGRKLIRQALASGTAQLPEIPLSETLPSEIGKNTVDAIRFGVDTGIVGTVREWLSRVKNIYPEATIIFTGGDSEFLAPEFPEAVVADEYFTLHGIRMAFEGMNTPSE